MSLLRYQPTIPAAKQLKCEAREIFADAKFELHKWHSSEPEVKTNCENYKPTFVKQQPGSTSTPGKGKFLGVPWDKSEDTLGVTFPNSPAELTKRGILANLAKVCDPLGLVSTIMLDGKRIYRENCNQKITWDVPLPEVITRQWIPWEKQLPTFLSTQRSLATFREPIQEVQLHAFGDASSYGVSAAVYAVVTQDSGVTQGLVTAKSRLAKQGLTIPRLELVSGHMAANVAVNVRNALESFPLASNIQCWVYSTVALHWLSDNGEYRQFLANRVRKIQSHNNLLWRHVPTSENPADLGSRGGSVTKAELWWRGPEWLADPKKWPTDIVTHATQESQAERKVQRELFVGTVEVNHDFDHGLEKFGLRKALRVCAWILRLTYNSRHPSEKTVRPLSTQEISAQELFWIKRSQRQGTNDAKFPDDKEQLNLKPNVERVLECRGRIQGDYPVCLPHSALYTVEVVQHTHVVTLHGGAGLTMAKVRERFWVPRLRKLTFLRAVGGCKRFRAIPAQDPPSGLLPREGTEGNTPFKVIGVDFAGPVKYLKKPKREQKAYVVLYNCSLTPGVFLELLSSLETKEFIQSLKRLLARQGRPSKVYSDNEKTFVAAAKWLEKVRKDEKFNDFLSQQSIIWQFNLSRAPWWGGQFERLTGLMKAAFYKSEGQGLLTWEELTEVLFDIESDPKQPTPELFGTGCSASYTHAKLVPLHQFQHTARTRALSPGRKRPEKGSQIRVENQRRKVASLDFRVLASITQTAST